MVVTTLDLMRFYSPAITKFVPSTGTNKHRCFQIFLTANAVRVRDGGYGSNFFSNKCSI